jgi:hypothetical protein
VTECPQKAPGFRHHSAGGELAMVGSAHWHGPAKGLAMGCSAAHMNSSLSLFLFDLFQNSIQI